MRNLPPSWNPQDFLVEQATQLQKYNERFNFSTLPCICHWTDKPICDYIFEKSTTTFISLTKLPKSLWPYLLFYIFFFFWMFLFVVHNGGRGKCFSYINPIKKKNKNKAVLININHPDIYTITRQKYNIWTLLFNIIQVIVGVN